MSLQNKKTVKTFIKMKQLRTPIAMLTAYDFTTASLLDAAGIDMILVGDSLSNVFLGNETTLPVTLDQMIYHAQAVLKGVSQAFVIVDMPFGSYQINSELAVENAVKIIKETGANAIKLEGGQEITHTVQKIVEAGMPVMGHLGLTPQSIHQLGSYEVQARSKEAQNEILANAKSLEAAGCFSIVLEKVPYDIAKIIAEELLIPVIGIGAGNACDGQVLVVNDMLGLTPDFNPKFVRKYAYLHEIIAHAFESYINDVKSRNFPNTTESY